MTDTPKTPTIQKPEDLSFEAALAELETIVRQLESGHASLEASIALYERGTALKKRCETHLKSAQMKVEKLTVDAAGQAVKTEDFK